MVSIPDGGVALITFSLQNLPLTQRGCTHFGLGASAQRVRVIHTEGFCSDTGSWSSGYDAALTRQKSVVRIRPNPYTTRTVSNRSNFNASAVVPAESAFSRIVVMGTIGRNPIVFRAALAALCDSALTETLVQ